MYTHTHAYVYIYIHNYNIYMTIYIYLSIYLHTYHHIPNDMANKNPPLWYLHARPLEASVAACEALKLQLRKESGTEQIPRHCGEMG